MARLQIITGLERRRSWSEEQKRAIVAAAFAPGAIVANVARRADVCAGQIYRWRQELCRAGGGFSEVVIAAIESGCDPVAAFGMLVNDTRGATLSIDSDLCDKAPEQNVAAGRFQGSGERVAQALGATPDVPATRGQVSALRYREQDPP